MKIIEHYKDGGTLKIEISEGVFYIDRRISTKTPNQIYDDYPDKGNIIEDIHIINKIKSELNYE